eukprot:CAMPEP_0116095012 /NCGR_PEP_ID=MMETSP0327-20121206/9436_1 /TAXON_ID=44447 /ORGANISM="Pseudo-nitzschia delicatissima, Strain B596" /LENGTH=515 /DNA_ID=CAMNT_0003586651 /DNA_START=33 /DNA_END=1580 /DNA_ORIENTATION=-
MRPNRQRPRRFLRQNDQKVLRLVSALIVVASVTSVWRCDASPTFGRRHRTSSNDIGKPVLPLKRRMHSWLIRNGSQSKISATRRQRIKHSSTINDKDCAKKRGSFMTSQKPTKERLFRWFGMEGEDPNQFMRCMMLRNEFNHNICGITNPFLKILPSSQSQQEKCDFEVADGSSISGFHGNRRTLSKPLSQIGGANCDGKTRSLEETVLSSRLNDLSPAIKLGSSKNIESSWWPSLQITQNQDQGQDGFKKWRIFQRQNKKVNASGALNGSFRQKDWRILTYRKRVGRGKACYEKVRDAALDWEFQSADGSTGMMEVPDSNPRGNFVQNTIPLGMRRSYSVRAIDDNESNPRPNAYSSSPSNYRSLGGSRRLVSYASKSVTEFLPSFLRRRIYSINPVMVVYDVVDQRAPDGQTTFTSTAYATLKGHYIRGEERVTVALRDGSQDVEVEILSISQAGPGLVGRTLWPFIGKMQSTFFQQQLHHLSQSGLVMDAKKSIGNGSMEVEKITQGNYPLQ